jgi:hypothetical protein
MRRTSTYTHLFRFSTSTFNSRAVSTNKKNMAGSMSLDYTPERAQELKDNIDEVLKEITEAQQSSSTRKVRHSSALLTVSQG